MSSVNAWASFVIRRKRGFDSLLITRFLTTLQAWGYGVETGIAQKCFVTRCQNRKRQRPGRLTVAMRGQPLSRLFLIDLLYPVNFALRYFVLAG